MRRSRCRPCILARTQKPDAVNREPAVSAGPAINIGALLLSGANSDCAAALSSESTKPRQCTRSPSKPSDAQIVHHALQPLPYLVLFASERPSTGPASALKELPGQLNPLQWAALLPHLFFKLALRLRQPPHPRCRNASCTRAVSSNR